MSEQTDAGAEAPADKPAAVCIQWPPTGRTQWVGRESFDRELAAQGWVLLDPQPERPKKPAGGDEDVQAEAGNAKPATGRAAKTK